MQLLGLTRWAGPSETPTGVSRIPQKTYESVLPFHSPIGVHPNIIYEIVYYQYVFASPASTYPNSYLVSPANMGDLRFRSTITWAEATAPPPLSALGGTAAAFGFSRQLRKRAEGSKAVGASATAV